MESTTNGLPRAQFSPALLRTLQLGWVLLCAAAIFVLVGAAIGLYVGWSAPCENAHCQATEEAFNHYGLTNRFYAITLPIGIAIEVLPLIIAGILVFWQRRQQLYELLFACMLVTIGVTALDNGILPSFLYIFPNLEWLGIVLRWVGESLIIVWFFFPNGRLVQRWAGWVAGAWLVLTAFVYLFPESPLNFYNLPDPWPNGVIIAMIAATLASLLQRYRQHSRLQERQQIRWVLASAALVASVQTAGRLIYPALEPGLQELQVRLVLTTLAYFSTMLLGISLGISILRYKLWNIDIVIQRASVYGALTLLLSLIFSGTLFVLTRISAANENRMLLTGVLSAAVFGAVFQPVRSRIQRFVDRRFYGIEIDYQRPAAAVRPAGEAAQTFGKFHDLHLVGRGGMAEVYRARRGEDPAWLALKLLPAALAENPDFRKRFQREAQTVQGLAHPNIVKILEYGEHANQPYILMEYIQGHDLAEHLRRVGRLPLAEARPLLAAIASALDLAHQQGIIHRDIKPSNIMLDESHPELRPVLMDFGIAKMLDGFSNMTQSGFLGTLDYVAPEQIRAAADIDARADIYAFGAMAYQLLAGELPFPASHPGALLMAHLTQPAPDLRAAWPEAPTSAARAIQRAMAKERDERFGRATDFVAALTASD